MSSRHLVYTAPHDSSPPPCTPATTVFDRAAATSPSRAPNKVEAQSCIFLVYMCGSRCVRDVSSETSTILAPGASEACHLYSDALAAAFYYPRAYAKASARLSPMY